MTCDCDGKCSCKPNIVGDTCDQCEIQHYDFPNCKGILISNFNLLFCFSIFLWDYILLFTVCMCNMEGSLDNDCDPMSGKCLCKNEEIGT